MRGDRRHSGEGESLDCEAGDGGPDILSDLKRIIFKIIFFSSLRLAETWGANSAGNKNPNSLPSSGSSMVNENLALVLGNHRVRTVCQCLAANNLA